MFEGASLELLVLAGICLFGLVMVLRGFRLSKDFQEKAAVRRELKRRLAQKLRQPDESEDG